MNLLRQWSSRAALALIVAVLLVGLASSFPADIAFLMAIDLGTWIEAAVAVYVVTQVTRIRPIFGFLRARFFPHRRSRRQIRKRVARKEQPSSDDDPAAVWAIAA